MGGVWPGLQDTEIHFSFVVALPAQERISQKADENLEGGMGSLLNQAWFPCYQAFPLPLCGVELSSSTFAFIFSFSLPFS